MWIGDPGPYLSWEDLRRLEQNGAEIGNHSISHQHLVRRRPDEAKEQWRDRVREDITQAQNRLQSELEHPVRILAYPYGEFTSELEDLIGELGYLALGQHSGPVGFDTPLTAIPRFPIATGFDDIERFAEKLMTRPFDLTVLAPANRLLPVGGKAPALHLKLTGIQPDGFRLFRRRPAGSRRSLDGR